MFSFSSSSPWRLRRLRSHRKTCQYQIHVGFFYFCVFVRLLRRFSSLGRNNLYWIRNVVISQRQKPTRHTRMKNGTHAHAQARHTHTYTNKHNVVCTRTRRNEMILESNTNSLRSTNSMNHEIDRFL